jgi:hypothetical protein
MDLHKLLALFTAVLCWDICLSQQHPVARRQAQDISDSRDAVGSSAEFLMHGEFVAALGSDAAFADCYLTTDEIASDPQAAAFAATFIAATAVSIGVDPADLVFGGISTVGNEGPGCGDAVLHPACAADISGVDGGFDDGIDDGAVNLDNRLSDGVVNIEDLLQVLAFWQCEVTDDARSTDGIVTKGEDCGGADFTGDQQRGPDGVVDIAEVLAVLSQFRQICPPPSSPPPALASWTPTGGDPTCTAQGTTDLGCVVSDISGWTTEVQDLRWNVPRRAITLDGDLSDWDGVEFKAQTPFRPCDRTADGDCDGAFVEFDVCTACVSTATYTGTADHAAAISFSWTPESLYAGIKVSDDFHQNPNSGWNGDSVQIMFTNAARPAGATAKTGEIGTPGGMILYNYGLGDDGSFTLDHEAHPCGDGDCTEMAALRNDATGITIYEIAFPAASMGQEEFYMGMKFGLGICVNDGDEGDDQDGQGGWSGWAPYGIVHGGGKQAENNGLAELADEDGVTSQRDWTIIFRQTAGTYKPAEEWVSFNPDDKSAPNFSALSTLEDCRADDGLFDLKILWPESENVDANFNIWRQMTNPVTSGVSGVIGYESVDINYSALANVDAEGSDDGLFYGLEHNTDPSSLLDGSVNHGYWFYAVNDTMKLSTVSTCLTDNFLM